MFCASPAPIPNVPLPCETLSNVIVASAIFDGCLLTASVTHVPSSTLFVTEAMAESITHGSFTIA